MELRRAPDSKPREIQIIITDQELKTRELKIIFDKGTLPISLVKMPIPLLKERFPALPAELINKPGEHPLFEPNGSRVHIPECLRKNFKYGLFIAATNKVQTLSLHRLDLYDNHRPQGQQKRRMVQDFSEAKTFRIIACEGQWIESDPIPILDGKTYCIGLNTSNPQHPKIIVEPAK